MLRGKQTINLFYMIGRGISYLNSLVNSSSINFKINDMSSGVQLMNVTELRSLNIKQN